MSSIALVDGNEMKWKIEKKIKRSSEQTRDKKNITAEKGGRHKDNFLAIIANGTILAFVTNHFLHLYRQMTERL